MNNTFISISRKNARRNSAENLAHAGKKFIMKEGEYSLFQPYVQDFTYAAKDNDKYEQLLIAWYIGFAVGRAEVLTRNIVIPRRRCRRGKKARR